MKNPDFNIKYLLTISMVAALGGFLFGYDWVVIGGAKPFYEQFFDIADSPQIQGWAMSSALIGCLFGAMLSGLLSEKYGRKRLLIFSALLFTLSAIGTGAVSNFNLFILWRLIGGVGIGLASTISPMYIAEVAPAKMRGQFVSLNQLTIVLGILAAQLTNWQIADFVPADATAGDILNSWNGQTGWRWMFWAEAIPALLFFLLMFVVPKSPRWLAKKGEEDEVKTILKRIGGVKFANQEYSSIKETLKSDTEKIKLSELLKPRLRKVMILGIVLCVFQQWCGINVIFNYAEEVFKAAGFGVSDILFNIVITGIINVVFTFAAIFMVDKLGRRSLLLIGSGGLAIVYILIGTVYFFQMSGWILFILVLLAIAIYAMSLAPVVWVVISEIFPNRIRGVAMSVATVALWSASFLLTYTFPILNDLLNASGTFWLYAGICMVGLIFIYKRLPETKNKTLEEIEHEIIDD
ncbi:sugar porter family MFS transporter [Bacteroidota bacterium]